MKKGCSGRAELAVGLERGEEGDLGAESGDRIARGRPRASGGVWNEAADEEAELEDDGVGEGVERVAVVAIEIGDDTVPLARSI